MSVLRRPVLVVAIALVLCGTAYGAGFAARQSGGSGGSDQPSEVAASPPASAPAPGPSEQTSLPTSTLTPTPLPEPEPGLVLTPGPVLLAPGAEGDDVRDLQSRLRQIDWFEADVTGYYGGITVEAVRGFQAKRELPATGEVDRRTLDRLDAMTTEPTKAELYNQGNTPGALDARCLSGRVICIDKSSQTVRWVVDGEVLQTLDARFGASSTPTREGAFDVYLMSRDHVSSLYDSAMPFAMFFSGGQAVHYSSDFAATGYAGASHGCVNTRDVDAVAWLFDQVEVGDDVVVYRS